MHEGQSNPATTADCQPESGSLPKGAWTAVFVLLALYTLAYLDRQIISIMVQPIRRDLDISDFQIGLLQGFAFALFYSTAGLPLGWLADRISRRWLIFFGVTVWAIATIACGLARNFEELLLARFALGAGEAALIPAAFAILSGLFPKERLTFAISVFSLGALLGVSLSWAIGGYIRQNLAQGIDLPLAGQMASWRFAFVATGLPGLVLGLLIFLIPEPSRGAAVSKPTGWTELFRFMAKNRAFYGSHFAGFSCIYALALINLSWLPTLLERRFAWEPGQIGFILGVGNLVLGGLAMLLTGRFVDRLVARGVAGAYFRFYMWASGGLFLTAGAFLLDDPWIMLGCIAMATLALQMGPIAGAALQVVTPPELRGKATAVYLLVLSLVGMTIGASLPAALTDYVFGDDHSIHLSIAVSFAVLAPLALVLFAFGLRSMRAQSRQSTAASIDSAVAVSPRA